MKTWTIALPIAVLSLCLALPAAAAGDVKDTLSRKGHLKIKGTNDGNQIKLDGGGGIDQQTVAPGAVFLPATKGVEDTVADAGADATCDGAISALSSAYVTRGGDPADLPC